MCFTWGMKSGAAGAPGAPGPWPWAAGAWGRPAPAAEPIFTLTRLTPGIWETAFEALLWSAAFVAGDCPAKARVKETSAS